MIVEYTWNQFLGFVDRASWAWENLLGQDTTDAWTPVLTFATPGDLSVSYSTQVGRFVKMGRLVTVFGSIVTSSFTHTTASGACRVTGLPFAHCGFTGLEAYGALSWQGITKANYTNISANVSGTNAYAEFIASGSAQNRSAVAAADMPSAGAVILLFTISYLT